MASEPMTKSGRSLDDEIGTTVVAGGSVREYILAIEKEAANKAVVEVLDRLERGVDALQSPPRYENDRNGNWWSTDMQYGWDIGTGDARALIASEREP